MSTNGYRSPAIAIGDLGLSFSNEAMSLADIPRPVKMSSSLIRAPLNSKKAQI